MCDVCLKCDCPPSCPGYQEKSNTFCDCCGEAITFGADYAEIDDAIYHIDCLNDIDTRELLRMCGVLIEMESEDNNE